MKTCNSVKTNVIDFRYFVPRVDDLLFQIHDWLIKKMRQYKFVSQSFAGWCHKSFWTWTTGFPFWCGPNDPKTKTKEESMALWWQDTKALSIQNNIATSGQPPHSHDLAHCEFFLYTQFQGVFKGLVLKRHGWQNSFECNSGGSQQNLARSAWKHVCVGWGGGESQIQYLYILGDVVLELLW